MEYSFLLKTLWWDLRILAGYLRHFTHNRVLSVIACFHQLTLRHNIRTPHCAIEFYDSIWPPGRIDKEFHGLESVSDALRYMQGSQHVARSLSCCRCFLAYVRASEIFDGEDMSSEKIRVGIMGAGGWAKYGHITALQSLEEFEIVAVASRKKA
jgi:hypothetical protein